MPNLKKRRAGAVKYQFNLYGFADYIMKVDNKEYVYKTVLVREAKRVVGLTQPLYSLYRDLNKAAGTKDIHGVCAVCVNDFNMEGHLCSVKVFAEEGKSSLFMEDEI